MSEFKLQYASKLSRKQAKDKICAHAMYGNHGVTSRPTSPRQVQEYLADAQ